MSTPDSSPRSLVDRIAVLVATAGGVGCLRPAPGTWGTLAAILIVAAWLAVAPPATLGPALWIGVAVAVVGGLASCGAAIRHFRLGDPPSVVIDEVAGTWLALAVVPPALTRSDPLLALLVAGLGFRVFDIAKPWPLSWLERMPGAWGIIMDDLAAGLLAGMLTLAVLH
jgi:phosphatidylglycerophosphatase A